MKTLYWAIDGNEANIVQRVGSNVYAYELLAALEKITRAQKAEQQFTILLSAQPLRHLPMEREGWKYQVVKPAPFWTQFGLPLYLFKNRKKYSGFYTPGHYAPRLSPIPVMSSVMDLAYLDFPEQFKKKDYIQLKDWTAYSIRQAKKVVAISEATKADIVKKYHYPAKKIVVAAPAVDASFRKSFAQKEVKELKEKLHITGPFLLYVGTLQPRKNLERLIQAFEKVATQEDKHAKVEYSKLQLVIAGRVGWLADKILARVEASPISDRIILTGFIDDDEKKMLYQETLGLVLVGLYEGFGMPALEAMAYATIPVVSNTTSLPEVVDGAGITVDPYSVPSIVNGLEKLLNLKSKERAQYLKKGREQVKKFTWEKSAKTVYETLQLLPK